MGLGMGNRGDIGFLLAQTTYTLTGPGLKLKMGHIYRRSFLHLRGKAWGLTPLMGIYRHLAIYLSISSVLLLITLIIQIPPKLHIIGGI